MSSIQEDKNSDALEQQTQMKNSDQGLNTIRKERTSMLSIFFGSYLRKDTSNLVGLNHKMCNIQFSVSRIHRLTGKRDPDWLSKFSLLRTYTLHLEVSSKNNQIHELLSQKKTLMEHLKKILMKDKSFKFKEERTSMLKQNVAAPDFDPLEVESLLQTVRNTDNAHLLILKCLKDKRLSLDLQVALDRLYHSDILKLTSCITAKHMRLYLAIPKGMFFVTKLMEKSDDFRDFAIHYCREHFWNLVSTELTSKLVIHFIEKCQEFRAFVFNYARKAFKAVLQSFTATYVVTMAIKFAESDQEYMFILDMCRYNLKAALQVKYFKRILVSYIEYCSRPKLGEIYFILGIEQDFYTFLKDKFLTFILLMFLKRTHEPFIQFICQRLKMEITPLSQAKYFPFFMIKVLTVNNRDLKRLIHSALVQVTPTALMSVGRHATFFYFYCYFVLATIDPGDSQELRRSLQQLEIAFGLAGEFGVTLPLLIH